MHKGWVVQGSWLPLKWERHRRSGAVFWHLCVYNSPWGSEVRCRETCVSKQPLELVFRWDSKFRGTFEATAALLKINIHVLSGENHNPMIVERICRYLNKCLTIFTNERDDNRVALEGILMSLYAWKSAPIIGTDISRSLIVVGREFQFPIDFSSEQH